MVQPIILFVDDEANILKTLHRLFLDEDYEIHTAISGKEGLEMIDNGLAPTVIVSDQRMPEMGGAEFLKRAKTKVPDSIRMVLTGYADINAAVDAINLGGIYRYILKPWDDQDLKLTIKEAIDRYNLVAENQRLSKELQEKNILLSEMNKNLEKKVQERTKELQYKVKELEGRDRIQQHLVTMHPLEETLQLVAEVVADVLKLSWTSIFLAEEEGSNLRQRKVAPNGITINENAVKEMLDSVAAEKMPKEGNIFGAFNAGAGQQDAFVCALPIKSSKKLYGALLVSRPADNGFSSDETRTLTGFCEQTAIALKDAEIADNIPDIGADLDNLLKDFANN